MTLAGLLGCVAVVIGRYAMASTPLHMHDADLCGGHTCLGTHSWLMRAGTQHSVQRADSMESRAHGLPLSGCVKAGS